ncbi:unnamed protein product [Zymoseptoria tritici ST99CH_3D1]|nr:unnamed protein product [Zymoseptoria tritici ST99CH_3D1]
MSYNPSNAYSSASPAPPLPSYHSTPPPPPPKTSTPSSRGPPLPPTPGQQHQSSELDGGQNYHTQQPRISPIEPGWLPETLRDKSTSDLHRILSTPSLQSALLTNPSTAHPSIQQSVAPLQPLINTNLHLTSTLLDLERQLSHLRQHTQTRLLSLRALEQNHRTKISETETALQEFSPMALYQRLSASGQEQEALNRGLEESWLEEEGLASEREVGEFVRRVKEGRKVAFLRRERKGRWDEGRGSARARAGTSSHAESDWTFSTPALHEVQPPKPGCLFELDFSGFEAFREVAQPCSPILSAVAALRHNDTIVIPILSKRRWGPPRKSSSVEMGSVGKRAPTPGRERGPEDRSTLNLSRTSPSTCNHLVEDEVSKRMERRPPHYQTMALILCAWIAATGFFVECTLAVDSLDYRVPVQPSKFEFIALMMWFIEFTFVISQGCIKLAILAIVNRFVKDTADTRIRYAIYACHPLQGFWRFFNLAYAADHEYYCIDKAATGLLAGVIAVISDLYTIAIPWAISRSFGLNKRQTFALNFVFMLGLIVTVASCLRTEPITVVYVGRLSPNLMRTIIWATVEIQLAIICACLPSLRVVYRLIMGTRFFESGATALLLQWNARANA